MQARKEIELTAIEALTPEEKNRLRRYADWRMLPIRGSVHHSDGEDLYNEVVARTLDGRRKWNCAEKTMFMHLLGAIGSIAADWYKEMKRYAEYSDVHRAPDTLHAQVAQTIFLQRLEQKLKGDVVASAVFESLRYHETPSEAIARLKLPKKVYEAARRRVLRRGRKLLRERGNQQITRKRQR